MNLDRIIEKWGKFIFGLLVLGGIMDMVREYVTKQFHVHPFLTILSIIGLIILLIVVAVLFLLFGRFIPSCSFKVRPVSYRTSPVKSYVTSDRTEQMVRLLNEMFKSPQHKKKHNKEYQELLQRNGNGYVYFAIGPNAKYTKIGHTTRDPYIRIKEAFGSDNTYTIKVVHLVRSNNPYETEQAFHRYFDNKRYTNRYTKKKKSEMFRLTEEDHDWIRGGLFPNEINRTI